MWWTIVAATIGSLTAILIAFIAYPWQKTRDRQLEIKSETRQAYLEFIQKFNELDKWIWGWESHDHLAYNSLRDEIAKLYLYAPLSVIEACSKALEKRYDLLEWASENKDSEFVTMGRDYSVEVHQAQFAEQAMIRLMREDLTGEKLSDSALNNLVHAKGLFGASKS